MSFKSVSCRNDSHIQTNTGATPTGSGQNGRRRLRIHRFSCGSCEDQGSPGIRTHLLLLLEDVLDFSAVFTDTLTLKSPLLPCQDDNNPCVTT